MNRIKRDKSGRFVSGSFIPTPANKGKPEHYKTITKYCECGCGKIVTFKPIEKSRRNQRFIKGHNARIYSKEHRQKCSEKASKTRRNNGQPRLTPIYKRIKVSKKYKEWRIQIFSRDGYRCQECGGRGGELNAHHIKPFSHIYREAIDIYDDGNVIESILEYEPLFELGNGITLCRECHIKVHNEKYA